MRTKEHRNSSKTKQSQQTDSDSCSNRQEKISEIFYSPLVQSIRKKYANIETISDFEWEDMKNQDSADVL